MTTRPLPRTPNLALRRARQSMRLSQAQFAEAIRATGNAMEAPNRCTKRLVQKWETGEHVVCRPDYLRVLQAVTGLSVRELGFQLLADDSGASTAGSSDGSPGADAMSTADRFSDEKIEGSLDRLQRALEHPSVVDARAAEFVETATARLFNLEHHSPARLLAPTLDRHLAAVTGLLIAAKHAGVRRRLMVSAGRSAMLAGWLAFDRGDSASAHRFWDTSVGAAEGTGDESLLAASLIYQSYAAVRRGDPATAWQLAHDASAHTSGDARATAWATTRVALYAAELGERGVAKVAMQRSLEIGSGLPNPKPGDGTLPWLRFFDTASLLSSTAQTAALLEDRNAAEYATQAVDALGPAKVKARAVVLAECALVAAMVGELKLCLEYGSLAITLTRELDVSIAADLLHEIVPLILPYADSREIRELLPQLTRLSRTVDLEDEAEQK